MANLRLLVAAGITLVLAGCSSKPDTATAWERDVERPLRYSNILVVAFDPNGVERLGIEKAVAADIDDQFNLVTPSSDIGLNFTRERWAEFESWIRANNKDAVVTIRPYRWFENTDVNEFSTAPTDHFRGVMADTWAYWDSRYDYGIELVVWDTTDWSPMWRARSARIDYQNRYEQIAEFVDHHAQAHGWWSNYR